MDLEKNYYTGHLKLDTKNLFLKSMGIGLWGLAIWIQGGKSNFPIPKSPANPHYYFYHFSKTIFGSKNFSANFFVFSIHSIFHFQD